MAMAPIVQLKMPDPTLQISVIDNNDYHTQHGFKNKVS